MKILKQTCIAVEIKVYETYKITIEINPSLSIPFTVKCIDDFIDEISVTSVSNRRKWYLTPEHIRPKIYSLIEKALGKTL